MSDIGRIRELFRQFGESTSAPSGLGFIDLKTREECFLNPDRVMPAASTYKVFLLMELFLQVQKGRVSLDDTMTLTDEDKSVGTGVLYSMGSGLELTVRDIAVLMISISDNTAADMLYRLLTPEAVRKDIIDSLGLSSTHIRGRSRDMIVQMYGRPVDLKESSEDYFRNGYVTEASAGQIDGSSGNCTSARDLSRAFLEIYDGTLFTVFSREEMLRILQLCQTNERLPKRLPAEVRTAHKTGSLDRITNDAGIIFTPYGPYILTMLVNGNLAVPAEYEKNAGRRLSDPLLAALSEKIYSTFVTEGIHHA